MEARTTRANEPSLEERAYRIRRNALRMGEVQGQGYIAQALGISDVLAVAYFHACVTSPRTRIGRSATASISRSAITRSRSMPC